MDELMRRRFEATAIPFMGVVYDASYRMTGDAADAQDITQETFLRAFRSFHSFEAGTNLRAWLLRIAYNVSCNDYRRRMRMPRVDPVGEEDDLVAELPSSDPGPEEEALRRLDREALHRALAQLPDPFRDAVTLVEIHGLSCAEAGEVMGTPRGTVLSRLHRARGRLRQILVTQAQAAEAGEHAKAS
jgi:RNA polymerase sigma-70 factor (ECF subfamily)